MGKNTTHLDHHRSNTCTRYSPWTAAWAIPRSALGPTTPWDRTLRPIFNFPRHRPRDIYPHRSHALALARIFKLFDFLAHRRHQTDLFFANLSERFFQASKLMRVDSRAWDVFSEEFSSLFFHPRTFFSFFAQSISSVGFLALGIFYSIREFFTFNLKCFARLANF